MGFFDAIILGIVQGLTEFLPVSSSGHLAVGQRLLGYSAHSHLLFDVIVHVGTLVVVVWFYRDSLQGYVRSPLEVLQAPEGEAPSSLVARCKENRHIREIFWIGLATIPTGVIGIAFQSQLKAVFGSLTTIAIMFIVTGLLLLVTRWWPLGAIEISQMGWWRALLIGLSQGIAILPGISRSGTTIAVALLLGMRRDDAARFSFLLAIPAISGAALLEFRKANLNDVNWGAFLCGGLAAAIVGYIALRFLLKLVQQGRLAWFTAYLWCLATAILVKLYVVG